MKIESEKLIERRLAEEVKNQGGWAIKLLATHITGLPDRLCLLPRGRLFFAEIKTTKKKPTKIQLAVHAKLRKLGFRVEVIDSLGAVRKWNADNPDDAIVSEDVAEASGKRIDTKEVCTCGNPSGDGDCHFEGFEDLIYMCSDCGKQVLD